DGHLYQTSTGDLTATANRPGTWYIAVAQNGQFDGWLGEQGGFRRPYTLAVDVPASDLKAVNLVCDGQGVQYTYSVSGVAPVGGVPVAFYWASGPNPSDILPGVSPALTTTLTGADATLGTHTKQLNWADLGARPSGATYVVMVLDPNNVISETI